MGPDAENLSYYDVSNNILGPKFATFVNRVVTCSVRQGVKMWICSMLLRGLVSQNWDTLHNDHASVQFSDEDIDGHGVYNKKP